MKASLSTGAQKVVVQATLAHGLPSLVALVLMHNLAQDRSCFAATIALPHANDGAFLPQSVHFLRQLHLPKLEES